MGLLQMFTEEEEEEKEMKLFFFSLRGRLKP